MLDSLLTLITTIVFHVRESFRVRATWIFHGFAGTSIIILNSDSGGQVEITEPICLSCQCQVTYKHIVKSL